MFEVVQKIHEINRYRGNQGKSSSKKELDENKKLAVDYIVAPPRMAHYIEYSTRIYEVYLRYFAPEDILVYSIDEVFIDATSYLGTYNTTAHEFALKIIRSVLSETGITATAGIGINMYLCKIAMDIVAKKMPPDKDGVRIAELDEMSYRRNLWEHTPLTDFWRVGGGIANKLCQFGIQTMGDIARCSIENEELLYQQFGVNAELLIDHAWGWEPVTMELAKAYKPKSHSISNGQVLQSPYPVEKAKNVVLEMATSLSLELVGKRILTDQVVLTIGYDSLSLGDSAALEGYQGKIVSDRYGRRIPAQAHGTANMDTPTSSERLLYRKAGELYDRIVNPRLLVRCLTLSANHIIHEDSFKVEKKYVQRDLFVDYEETERQEGAYKDELAKERRRQETIIRIKDKFGKNAILKGINYADGATQREKPADWRPP